MTVQAHRGWVDDALRQRLGREVRWSEAIAVGRLKFVENIKSDLGIRAAHREVIAGKGTYPLRDEHEPYGADFTAKNEALGLENTRFWNEYSKTTAT